MVPRYNRLLTLIGGSLQSPSAVRTALMHALLAGEPGGLRVLLKMRADALKSCSQIHDRNLATLAVSSLLVFCVHPCGYTPLTRFSGMHANRQSFDNISRQSPTEHYCPVKCAHHIVSVLLLDR